MILGVGIAYVVVRSRLPGREALDVMAMLPLAVPGLVIAFGYLAMSREGKLFDFINPVENPMALLIIAYAVRRLPLVVRSAVAGLQQTSDTSVSNFIYILNHKPLQADGIGLINNEILNFIAEQNLILNNTDNLLIIPAVVTVKIYKINSYSNYISKSF